MLIFCARVCVCRGRLKHGRHFTYKSLSGDVAITLVCAGVQGALVTESQPVAAHGPWVQIYVSEGLMDHIAQDFCTLLQKVKAPPPLKV